MRVYNPASYPDISLATAGVQQDSISPDAKIPPSSPQKSDLNTFPCLLSPRSGFHQQRQPADVRARNKHGGLKLRLARGR